MDHLMLLKALVLGVVEGLTEFLPVSSTGHLILAGEWLEFNRPEAKTFEVVIQLGAILSVCWHFRARLWPVAATLGHSPTAQSVVLRRLIAFLPAAGLGLLFHDYIKSVLFNPTVVAWAMIGGGLVILAVERLAVPPKVTMLEELDLRLAFKIGLCQALALIPGVSRSGATIMGGMWLGVSRQCATEFSFFLAIPVMFAATIFDLYKSWDQLTLAALPVFATGFIAAFLSALAAVRFLLRFVATHSFVSFAWYRIAFGLLVLWVLGDLPLTAT